MFLILQDNKSLYILQPDFYFEMHGNFTEPTLFKNKRETTPTYFLGFNL